MALTETAKIWRATKRGHMSRFLGRARERAKQQNLPCDLDVEFLLTITTDECPVFKTPFVWGQGRGQDLYGPSLDRVVPELGYVKYNVVFISNKANTIKQDITETELYAVADWLHDKRKEVLKHVAENSTTSIPAGDNSQSGKDPKPGTVPAPRTWEDRHYPDDYRRPIPRQDTDSGTKESS